jgi:hypothetical protein
MESMTLPDGYLLPPGMTMTDVRQLDLELLASEGLKIEDGADRPFSPRTVGDSREVLDSIRLIGDDVNYGCH